MLHHGMGQLSSWGRMAIPSGGVPEGLQGRFEDIPSPGISARQTRPGMLLETIRPTSIFRQGLAARARERRGARQ
jgi:hypothetical protein